MGHLRIIFIQRVLKFANVALKIFWKLVARITGLENP